MGWFRSGNGEVEESSNRVECDGMPSQGKCPAQHGATENVVKKFYMFSGKECLPGHGLQATPANVAKIYVHFMRVLRTLPGAVVVGRA